MWRLALPTASMALLAAHFLRQGEMGIAASWLLLAGLLFSRQAWVRLTALTGLGLGFFLWLESGMRLIHLRLALDLPWTRLALILGLVAAFTFLSFVFLLTARKVFSQGREQAWPRASAAILSVGLLTVTRIKAPLAVLLADRFLPAWGFLEIALLGLYASWAAGRLLDPTRSAATRALVWRLFSLIFFLQLGLGLAGMDQLLMTGKLHLPVPALILAGPLFRGQGFFMLILFTVSVLLVGPAWCSHLCYIGAWDDALAKGRTKPEDLPAWTRHIRPLSLLLVLAAALGLRLAEVPLGLAASLAAAFGLVGVGVMVFISRQKGVMVHCTSYCPLGLVADLLGKLAPWRIVIGPDCTGCGRCSRACRYSALNDNALKRGRPRLTCSLCGDCLNACPHGQIGMRLYNWTTPWVRPAFVALAAALHALFLGVARI